MSALQRADAFRYDFFGELCVALKHRWLPKELFVIFTGYFDEADTHGPFPTVILAAYVGHADQWRRFEKRLLKLQIKYGFSVFHGKDFKSRHGEFSKWTDAKCDSLVADLLIAVRRLTQGITVSLSRERYLTEYRSHPIPKKLHLDSQFGVCFRTCVGHLLRLMAGRGNVDRINIVLEGGHPNVTDCIRIFDDIKTRAQRMGNNVMGTITIARKRDCMPLMVADFLASAHSKLRAEEAAGTVDRTPFVLPVGAPIPKGSIAILELAPNALRELKLSWELGRKKEIEQWRARRAEKGAINERSSASGEPR